MSSCLCIFFSFESGPTNDEKRVKHHMQCAQSRRRWTDQEKRILFEHFGGDITKQVIISSCRRCTTIITSFALASSSTTLSPWLLAGNGSTRHIPSCYVGYGISIVVRVTFSHRRPATIARVDGCCRCGTGRVAVIHALDIIYSIRPINVPIGTT